MSFRGGDNEPFKTAQDPIKPLQHTLELPKSDLMIDNFKIIAKVHNFHENDLMMRFKGVATDENSVQRKGRSIKAKFSEKTAWS